MAAFFVEFFLAPPHLDSQFRYAETHEGGATFEGSITPSINKPIPVQEAQ